MTHFKLSPRSRAILENFSRINTAIVISQGKTIRTVSPSEQVTAFATIAEEIPDGFAVYDLSKFLGITDLYDTPTLEVETSKKMNIRGIGKVYKYVLSLSDEIMTVSDEQANNTIKECEEKKIQTFTLTAAELSLLRKNISIGKLPFVSMESDGTSILLKGINIAPGKITSDEYQSVISEKAGPKFNIVFTDNNIQCLLDGEDYEVTISGLLTRFSTKDIDYYIAQEAESDYD